MIHLGGGYKGCQLLFLQFPVPVAFLLSLGTALGYQKLVAYISKRSIYVSGFIARKATHIGMGVLFVLTWAFFPDSRFSKYFAALVPFLASFKILLIYFKVIDDQGTIDSMTRMGKRSELIKGPFQYGIVHGLIAIICWKQLDGVMAVVTLCVGDGFAELFGRMPTLNRGARLIGNTHKTYAGVLGFIVTCFLAGLVLPYFCATQLHWFWLGERFAARVLLLSLVCSLVEATTPCGLDNVTVPIAAVLLCRTKTLHLT